MMLNALLFVLASPFCYSLMLKRRMENFIFPALAADVVILYFFALFNLLPLGFYTVVTLKGAALLATICLFARNREEYFSRLKEYFLTPGLVFVIVGVWLAFWLPRGRFLSTSDEFGWWGMAIRSAVTNGVIPLVSGDLAKIRYISYIPGTQLGSYLIFKWCRVTYSENFCYVAANLLSIAALSIFFRTSRWREAFWNILLAGVLIALPCYFYENYYSTVYVDAFLGVIFGAVLFMVLKRQYDWCDAVLLTFSCSFLLLIKNSAALLAALVLIINVFYAVKEFWHATSRRIGRKAHILKALAYILPFSAYIVNWAWKLALGHYLKNTTLLSMEGVSGYGIIDALVFDSPSISYGIIEKFMTAFVSTPLLKIGPVALLSPVNYVLLLAVLIFIAVAFFYEKEDRLHVTTLTILLIVGFLVYGFSLMLLYILSFSPAEAKILAAFQRYLSTFFTAFTLLGVGVAMYCRQKKFLLVFAPFIFLIPWMPLYYNGDADRYSVYRKPVDIMVQFMDQKNDRFYCIDQESAYGLIDRIARYERRGKVACLGSIGSFAKPDSRQRRFTPKDFIEDIKAWRCRYCYLMKVDDVFKKQYGDAFVDADDIEDARLFYLNDDDKLELFPIQYFTFDFEYASLLETLKKTRCASSYDSTRKAHVIRMRADGNVTLAPAVSVKQQLIGIALDVEVLKGHPLLKIMNGGKSVVAEVTDDMFRAGRVEVPMDGGTMESITFNWSGVGDEDVSLLIKRVDFTFEPKISEGR